MQHVIGVIKTPGLRTSTSKVTARIKLGETKIDGQRLIETSGGQVREATMTMYCIVL